MKRVDRGRALWLLCALSWCLGLSSCGEESDRRRIARASLQPTQTLEGHEVPAVRQDIDLDDVYVWPVDAGPPRDLETDHAACAQEMESTSDVAAASPLVKFIWLKRCVEQKGWVVDPDLSAGAPN